MTQNEYYDGLEKCESSYDFFNIAEQYIQTLEKELETLKTGLSDTNIRYKKEIEELKKNDTFKSDTKVQLVCLFREIIQDQEMLLNGKRES